MDDALVVLDAVGSERAALLGVGFGGQIAMLLAASHPDRSTAVVLVNSYARILKAPDYPMGISAAFFERFQESLVDPAQEALADDVDLIAPSQAHALRYSGREVKAMGDGFLATFDGPARAIQCGLALRDGAHQLGMDCSSRIAHR